jgi:hypothetical protein
VGVGRPAGSSAWTLDVPRVGGDDRRTGEGVAAVRVVTDGSADGYDPDRYYEQVVRGLRGRPHDLPADLVRRYALPDQPTGATLRTHLDQVVRDWEARVEATREGEVYRALLAAHATLEVDPEVDLRSPEWWAHYRRPPDQAAPPLLRLRPAAAPSEDDEAAPAGATAVAEPPFTGTAVAEPPPAVVSDLPRELTAHRCRVGAELAWVWPSWGAEAVVEWPTNAPDGLPRDRAHLTRHDYEQTGCWRTPVRDEETTFAVQVLGIGRSAPPLTATVGPRAPEVHYTISRLWWRLGAHYRVVVSSRWPPPPYCELVVGWSPSRFLPDPEELEELASFAVGSGTTSWTVSVPRGSGARWVRCYLRDGDDVDLHEPDTERLKVHSWPR